MMAFTRRIAHSFFAKIVLLFVLICFIVWGIGDIPNVTGAKNLAKIDNEYITDFEYKRDLAIVKESFGEHYSPQIMKQLNIYKAKLDQLIDMKLIDLEAERTGLSVSDESLAQSVASEATFEDSKGKFDKALFTQWLKQNNLSEYEYMRNKRSQLTSDLLTKTFEIHPMVSEDYFSRLYDIKHARRGVSLFVIAKPKDLTPFAPAMPSQEQIEKYYSEHKNYYMSPEYRTVQFIEISPKAIIEGINVSEKEAQAIYQARIKDFEVPQRREIDQLLYKTKSEAENAHNLLRSAATFDDVIVKVPPQNKDAIHLGERLKSQLTEGAEEVFSLEKNGFTLPIESAFGWHIFKVSNIIESHTASFDTVRKDIEQEIKQEKGNTILNEKIEQLEDALAANPDVASAAKNADLPLYKATNIDATGVSYQEKHILTSETYAKLLERAFKQKNGEVSNVFSTNDGHHFVVKTYSITPQSPKPLDAVRELVIKDMKEWLAVEKIKMNAQDLAKKLPQTSSAQIPALLQQYHAEMPRSEIIGRTGLIKPVSTQKVDEAENEESTPLPDDMIDTLFTLEKTGSFTNFYPYNDGYIIARLDNMVVAPDRNSPEGKGLVETLKTSLIAERRSEFRQAFVAQLRKKYRVEVYDNVLQAIIAAEDATSQETAQ